MRKVKSHYLLWILVLLFLFSCQKKAEEQKNLTTDHKRHIELEGQSNFRDLGGYKTTDGHTVKWGQIYRSGKLPKLTDQDVNKLESLQLHTVINFLTPKELESHGRDRLPGGINEIPLPMNSKEFLGDLAAEILVARQTGNCISDHGIKFIFFNKVLNLGSERSFSSAGSTFKDLIEFDLLFTSFSRQ